MPILIVVGPLTEPVAPRVMLVVPLPPVAPMFTVFVPKEIPAEAIFTVCEPPDLPNVSVSVPDEFPIVTVPAIVVVDVDAASPIRILFVAPDTALPILMVAVEPDTPAVARFTIFAEVLVVAPVAISTVCESTDLPKVTTSVPDVLPIVTAPNKVGEVFNTLAPVPVLVVTPVPPFATGNVPVTCEVKSIIE